MSVVQTSRFQIAIRLLGIAGLVLGSSGSLSAQEEKAFPGKVVESVLIPLPSEVFGVLDKLGGANWGSAIADRPEAQVRGGRLGMALQLGVVIAEGFVATQAEDAEAIKETGNDILRLAGALGIRGEIEAHCQAILDSADSEDWTGIRREFDRAEVRVREAMARMKDEDLAQCVSLGGWLRGTEVLAGIVVEIYTADRAELLSQPLVVEHLGKRATQVLTNQLEAPSRELVVEVRKGLQAVGEILEKAEDEALSNLQAKEVGRICSELVARIREGK